MVGRENATLDWLPKPGEIVAGRFRVGEVLGSGGMGAVVSAFDAKLADNIAIKFLHPRLASQAENTERFVREAQATSRIKSEHVVRVLDVGQTERGLHYIVMERLEGEDLAAKLNRGRMPLTLAVDCVLQAGEALAEAHGLGVIHRDIKASNLWLARRADGTPVIKVLDFGISKLMGDMGGVQTRVTETQAVFGSPTYMSPEQVRSAKRVDAKTDVWALAIVLFELLTTSTPFDGENVGAVLSSVAADPPVRLRTLYPDAPAEVELAILECLEKDPTRRATLADFATRLRPFASEVGQVAADRIRRIASQLGSQPSVRPSVPSMPMPVSSPSVQALTLAATERNIADRGSFSDTQSPSPRRGRLITRAVVATAAAGVIAFLATMAVTTGRGASTATGAAPDPVVVAPVAAPSALPASREEPPTPTTPTTSAGTKADAKTDAGVEAPGTKPRRIAVTTSPAPPPSPRPKAPESRPVDPPPPPPPATQTGVPLSEGRD